MNDITTYLNLPFANNVDISEVAVADVMAVLRGNFGEKISQTHARSPESEALEFYMSNHVLALIRTNSTAGQKISIDQRDLVERYGHNTSELATRAFAYLMVICTREMRHLNTSSIELCGIKDGEVLVYDFIRENIKSSVKVNNTVWGGDIPFAIGLYTTVLEKMFRNGSWGGGYGGSAWADVTKCLRDYVYGTLTAEMMVDTVWTLCHNNGPIFNKGVLYTQYSKDIYRILDVQRAGQIPQFEWGVHATDWFKTFLSKAIIMFPELGDEPDLWAIKKTALHSEYWGHIAKKKGFKIVKKSGGHSESYIGTQTVEIKR